VTTIDLLVKRLRDEKISLEEKILILDEFKKELKRNESGDLNYFKDTAIPDCFRFFYNFYLKNLSSQSAKCNAG